jgi:pilus assembly protein CpaE
LASGSWQIVLVTAGRKVSSELLPIVSVELPFANVVELQGYPKDGRLGEQAQKATVCLLDLITNEQAGLETLGALTAAMPNLPIVSLVPEGASHVILQALRRGAKDFLAQPFSTEQFRAVAEKLAPLIPELATKLGRVISVLPAKGGCGASTIALNLATQLKKQGSTRTLLADLDPATGTLAFQMKLKPQFSFAELLSDVASMDADIWRGVVQTHGGIDVLLSPENPLDGAQELGDTRPMLDFARRLYDTVVVDLGNAYGEWALSALRASDEVLLVTTNELPALQSAQRVLNYYEGNLISRERLRLVVNRFNRDVGLTQEMIETALQTEIYELIPSDYHAVQTALLDGKAIQASTAIGKSLTRIAERILGVEGGKKKKESEPARSGGTLAGLLNLFSRPT